MVRTNVLTLLIPIYGSENIRCSEFSVMCIRLDCIRNDLKIVCRCLGNPCSSSLNSSPSHQTIKGLADDQLGHSEMVFIFESSYSSYRYQLSVQLDERLNGEVYNEVVWYLNFQQNRKIFWTFFCRIFEKEHRKKKLVCSPIEPIESIRTTILGYGAIYLRLVLDDISEFAQEWESEPLFGKPTMFFRTENSKYTVISLKDISLKDSLLISCFSSVNRSIKEERVN